MQKIPRRGRPGDSRKTKGEKRKKRIELADRLRDVAKELNLSQAEIEAKSGVSQGTLSAVISGKRGLSLADLQKLGAIGIPPDFLLGLTDTFIPPGQTRPEMALLDELAAAVWNRVRTERLTLDVGGKSVSVDLRSRLNPPKGLDREQLLTVLVDKVRKDVESWIGFYARMETFIESLELSLILDKQTDIEGVAPRIERISLALAAAFKSDKPAGSLISEMDFRVSLTGGETRVNEVLEF